MYSACVVTPVWIVRNSQWQGKVYKTDKHIDFYNTPEWRRLRRECLYRDRYTCHRCDKRMKSADLTAHHLIPRMDDGPDILENLITLCGPCHDFSEIHNLRTRIAIAGSWENSDGVVKQESAIDDENDDSGYYKNPDEDFFRPNWHRWVYGGVKRRR